MAQIKELDAVDTVDNELAGEGLLLQHFNGALKPLQMNFNGTSMAQKKTFLGWLMSIIFYGLL